MNAEQFREGIDFFTGRFKISVQTGRGKNFTQFLLADTDFFTTGKKDRQIRLNHNAEKDYLEYYAKMLLENLFQEKYSGLQMDETPDLRMGNDYGIEVTWAMFRNQGQANGVFNHINGKSMDQVDQRYIQTMNRILTEIITKPDGVVCGYAPKDGENKASYNEIIQAYRKKRTICYSTVHTDLFIYPPLAQLDGWLGKDQIEECVNLLGEDSDNLFAHLIIYEEPTLYLYDIQQKKLTIRRGTEDVIIKCKKAADSYSGWSKRFAM